MIEIIGLKRILSVIILAVLAGLFATFNYYVFVPQTQVARAALNRVSTENSTLRTEIDKMRDAITQFESQKAFFEKMDRLGFFNEQDRVLARERFDIMQKMSKILKAKYEIKAANIVPSDMADKAEYAVLESPISIELAAIDDLDVYRFIYFLNYGFPGHITVKNLTMERKMDVTAALLKQVGVGAAPDIITAKMNLEWRTMARKSVIMPGYVPETTGAVTP